MKILLHDNDTYVLRFDLGEEVISGLKKFGLEENIEAASFQAIGAVQKAVIAYYDLKNKRYEDKILEKDLEIVGVMGNVARMGEEVMIHAHGSFSDEKFQTFSGHVKSMVVSLTCEVTLTKLEGKLMRRFDEGTGLNLLF